MKPGKPGSIDLTALSQNAEAARKDYQAAIRALERARLTAETAEASYAAHLGRFTAGVEAVKVSIKPPIA